MSKPKYPGSQEPMKIEKFEPGAEWVNATIRPLATLCLAVYGEIAKDSCLRPKGHDGEHRDGSGFRWPYTSKELLSLGGKP